MIFNIKEKLEENKLKRKQKKVEILRFKREEIRKAMIDYYEAKQLADGGVNIPSFMLADMTMAEICKTSKDVNYLYRKLQEYRKAGA